MAVLSRVTGVVYCLASAGGISSGHVLIIIRMHARTHTHAYMCRHPHSNTPKDKTSLIALKIQNKKGKGVRFCFVLFFVG